jgi:hypothetical protein
MSLSSSFEDEEKAIVNDNNYVKDNININEQQQETETATADDARRSCHSCYHTFCAVHGDAHPGVQCSDYQLSRREARQIQKSEASLKQWTKSCSHAHCGARIHKAAGCDHVLCPACHNDMCFKCGTHLYLSGKVVRSCSMCQQGFVDHRYNRQYRCRQCFWLPFLLPAMFVYVAIMSVVAVLTLGFGCCFRCGLDVYDRDAPSTTASASSSRSTQHKEYAPRRGIQLGATLIFLPLVGLLRDYGIPYCHDFDEIFAEENELDDIPIMTIDNDNSDDD